MFRIRDISKVLESMLDDNNAILGIICRPNEVTNLAHLKPTGTLN